MFGEDTPELHAFYQAMTIVAPGAWELLQDLLASWRPWALSHEWQLPDGFEAKVKVMGKKEARVEVDELGHSTFTYEYYENVGTEQGLSNVANVVHSVDAYVLRCVHRRCNYARDMVAGALSLLTTQHPARDPVDYETKLGYYIQQWERSGIADVVILPYITYENVAQLSSLLTDKLVLICKSMLTHNPFEVVTIHDEFKCHPNNMNHLRFHYKEILADLADSNLIDDLLSQIHGEAGTFNKLSEGLGNKIREANYALC